LRASRRLRPPILLAGTAVLAAAVIPWYARQDGRPPAALDAIPIATEPGLKSQPTFSPDGNHVAFRWNSQRQDNFDIYVKLIGTSSPLRLTTHPASDYSPAWSPDGRHIAFLRETHSALSAVILIPPLGGPERKLAEVYGAGSLCWSPDGKWLYLEDRADYHDPEAIFALSVDTGEKRRLTNPPRRGDRDPAISPDGHTLAFVRFPSSSYGDIYVLRINGGTAVAEARRISTDHRIVSRPAWTPDGQLIVVNGPVGNFHLSRLSLDGNSPPARLISDEVADDPTVSLDHRRLAYTKITKDTNIWRVDASRNEVARPVEFISSSRLDFNPQYSPDGTRLVFSSNRTGAFEVWTANNDGSGLLQLTSFGGAQVGSPRWSPDQRRIAFDHSTGAESRVYTVSAEGGEPRIVPNTGFAAVPNWSRDGRWIYYASNRTGIFEIWKISEQQGVPVQVTRNGGYVAFESWDGRDLYYSKTDGPAMIWKMSLAGAGHESPAISEPVPYRAWGVTRDGLWFIPAPAGEGAVLKFLSFDGKVRTIAKVSKPVSWGLTVSPDQRTVLYSQIDQNGSDLMLVDRFH
jgi:Tol biopolymer transport system component